VDETLIQALWITLFGMGATFAALALVMLSMFLLTRLIQDAASPDRTPEVLSADPGLEYETFDAILPVGTPLEEIAAAAVAVAAARELARQRYSAQVWLSSQPRSLISPWQLVARDKQLDRLEQ